MINDLDGGRRPQIYYESISFSPDGSKIVAIYARSIRIRVIDARVGTILSDGWNESMWKTLAGFANENFPSSSR